MPQNLQTPKKGISLEEWHRLLSLITFEETARKDGYKAIAGIDEAGRGPLAGPVVAAACIIPSKMFFPGVDDSKKLTPKARAALFKKITASKRVCYGVGIISHEEIDKINIYQATIQAMLQAITKLAKEPDFLLVDGMKLLHPSIPCQKIIAGDSKSQSIAAASIIAKETRDQLMVEYHEQWPHYGFAQHKGYATQEHIAAINKHGPCPIHRLTFNKVVNSLQ